MTDRDGVVIQTLAQAERAVILEALRATRGNQREACRILGCSRWSLARRLEKHGIVISGVMFAETPPQDAPSAGAP